MVRVTILRALSLVLLAVFAGPVAAEESRWALLVGIDDYIDSSISSLSGSVNDVVAIREALVTTAHFPSSQVFLLTSDDPGNAPTRGNIRARLDHIARNADSDDLVYLHFSLHAVLDDDTGEGYLLTHRTDPRNVVSDGLPVVELRKWLETLSAPKRMLVLDGCRNDPEAARGDRDNRRDERFSRGLVLTPRVAPSAATAFTQILFACSPGERAYEWPGRDRGLFSVALEEALKGEADGPNGDGRVTLGELCIYVRERVPELLSVHLPGKVQHPDVPKPPAAARSYALSDAQAGGGLMRAVDLPAVPRRATVTAEADLDPVFDHRAAKEPTVQITGAPEGPLTRAQARALTLHWEADVDRAVTGYRYRLDNGPAKETARAYADLTVPEPGQHTFQVRVKDFWDNWSVPAKLEFEVLANRRPAVGFTGLAQNARVEGQSMPVSLQGSDPGGSIVKWRLSLDDPDAYQENTTGRFELNNLTDGRHTLFAQAIDDEGAASLWESVAFQFRYVDPERAHLEATGTTTGRTAGSTNPEARRWTKGQPAPQVDGFSLVGNNAEGYPEYDTALGGGVTMRFVLVPAGSFTMGSPSNEADRESFEGPQHRVTLDAFLIAKTECTQGQWQAVMGNNPSYFPQAGLDAPVEQVSWEDIQGFESKTTLSLPSEAQWEYAARAGNQGARHGSLSIIAWSKENSGSTTHPVGEQQSNDFGLHDMIGNVWEWCEDTWNGSYSGEPSDESAWVDTGSSYRAGRGGSWSVTSGSCRSALRSWGGQGVRYNTIGFRPSRPLGKTSPPSSAAGSLSRDSSIPPPAALPKGNHPSTWTKGQPAPQVEGFTLVGDNAQGYPEYDKQLDGGVTMRFVLVPAGSFTMGSPSSEVDRSGYEGPKHPVTLEAFLLAKTECTQRQWQAVIGNNPSDFTSAGLDAPVEMVSWVDIQGFENKTALSLPSEAQWEYAARAGTQGARHGHLSNIAWSKANSGSTTHTVAQNRANSFGLHDMIGNVWEWCEDTWHGSYRGAPNKGSAWVDAGSSDRVLRGGSWGDTLRRSRSAYRSKGSSGFWNPLIGFRPSRPLR